MACSTTRKKFECSFCLDVLTVPKILPCFHTFCQDCLHKMTANSTLRSFKCPQCRQNINVPQGGVAKFQTNFYISEDLEQPQAKKVEKCSFHQNQNISYVCRKCNNIPICQECKVKIHKGHDTSAIEEEVADAKNELQDIHARLKKRIAELETGLLGRVKTLDTELAQRRQEAHKSIADKTNELIAKLTTARDEALEMVEKLISKHQSKLDKTILRFQKAQAKTKSLQVQTEKALEDELVALSARDTLWEGLDSLENVDQLLSDMSRHATAPLFTVDGPQWSATNVPKFVVQLAGSPSTNISEGDEGAHGSRNRIKTSTTRWRRIQNTSRSRSRSNSRQRSRSRSRSSSRSRRRDGSRDRRSRSITFRSRSRSRSDYRSRSRSRDSNRSRYDSYRSRSRSWSRDSW